MPRRLPLAAACVSLAALVGCGAGGRAGAVPVRVGADPLIARGACTGRFRPIDLDHTTASAAAEATTVEATGAGVAVGDLDGNGWDDIVLAGLGGPTEILWNSGGLRFDRSVLGRSRTRQVTVADVDGDGHNDVVATSGIGPPVWYRNAGGAGRPTFEQRLFAGVTSFAFSVGIGDLHGDGHLAIATGSYNAELLERRDTRALVGDGIGVSVHEPGPDGYVSRQLSDRAQALVTQIADLDGDGRADVVVGNDLSTPDMAWAARSGKGGRLTPIDPFTTTSLSTMSLDIADYDDDGRPDVFATDMKPMADEPTAQWSHIFEQIRDGSIDDVQRPHNVLQHATRSGFEEVSAAAGVDATGWSWSGLFGDLDADGRQDLYVVNGMESPPLLHDNPGNRLVEANQAFRNDGARFTPAPDWGLGDMAGGRGMAIADLDHDGRLDIVVNNLNAPARLFANDTCAGHTVEVALTWAGSHNTAALGAKVAVTTGTTTRTRYVNATRGYLSGSGTVVHVGLGDAAAPVRIDITWPDGKHSVVRNAAPDQLLHLTRTDPN